MNNFSLEDLWDEYMGVCAAMRNKAVDIADTVLAGGTPAPEDLDCYRRLIWEMDETKINYYRALTRKERNG